MTTIGAFSTMAAATARRLTAAFALAWLFVLAIPPAVAADQAQLFASQEPGFARLVLSFPGRLDLPKYNLRYDNNVLAIEFDEPVSAPLPDIASVLPDYATVARVDPDGRGIRIGLRSAMTVNRMEAGEKLYVDLLPLSWEGMPPPLPPEVVAELAERAKHAAELAEQRRKAEQAKELGPVATVSVGRNPTFMRVEFDWSTDTNGRFAIDENGRGILTFDWPVPIDLYELKADLPAEITSVDNIYSAKGSQVVFNVAEGTVPRFYQQSPTQFVLDVDISTEEGMAAALKQEEIARKLAEAAKAENAAKYSAPGTDDPGHASLPTTEIIPRATLVGDTVRIAFPFDQDVAAAVFRRGDTVWMLFDSSQSILPPERSEALDKVASTFQVTSSGETRIVRMDLTSDRLATLGSEGRAWVLSLGDTLLGAAEPLPFSRQRTEAGQIDMHADLKRPGAVHVFNDPIVGDTLDVVTVMPPARGVSRNLDYVDFSALRSAHGLVIKPNNPAVSVALQGEEAIISADGGLSLSDVSEVRMLDAGKSTEARDSYMPFDVWHEDDPSQLSARADEIMARAAAAESGPRDNARLDLATLYVANDLGFEALGVLRVLKEQLSNDGLRKKVGLVEAVANTLSGRSKDAIAILSSGSFPEEADALLWRTIARADAEDYAGARLDALAASQIAGDYPNWVRNRFNLAALRSVVETSDPETARELVGRIDFATLDPEQVTTFQLLQGRLAELEDKPDDALDDYGVVIAADVRPTRAEAIYRTLLLLQKTGKIDAAKAADTLATEAMAWRGGSLEANMRRLLAELYFANRDYRDGFNTVKVAAASFPDNSATDQLVTEAQRRFEELFLNGAADSLDNIQALALYYDFRELTPPGARGDEMIRNLARRLIRVDLLQQAGDLLEYQIDTRLSGIGRAQVAADLAVIRIADREPEEALRVLNRTRMADLPPSLDRQRRVLEARAMVDAGRQDLALDLISRLEGRDIDLLRIDGYWKSKNYRMAAELLETLHNPAGDVLSVNDRMGILKAAVGYVLSDDMVGLSRLRSKFGDRMAKAPEWPLFDYVTHNVEPQSDEFKKLAREVAATDSLDAFIQSYRETFPAHSDVVPNNAVAA